MFDPDVQAPIKVETSPHSNTIAEGDTSTKPFRERFRDECIEGSAISPDLYETAIEIVPSYRTLPGNDPEHPIDDLLKWEKKFVSSNRPSWGYGAVFRQFNGDCFQIKPEHPRTEEKKGKDGTVTQKVIKYETPKGNGAHAYCPPLDLKTLRYLGKVHDVEIPEDGGQLIWDYIRANPSIPIVITEGAKKGLCLLSNGYVGIALTGCYGWKHEKNLIHDLQAITWEGRRVIIALDQDEKPETQKTVMNAIKGLGFELQGTKDKPGQRAKVFIAQWNSVEGKGIDDLTANRGLERLNEVMEKAVPLIEWAYPKKEKKSDDGSGKGGGEKKKDPPVADQLVELVQDRCSLWHTPDDQCFADIKKEYGGGTFPLHSTQFKKWLRAEYFEWTDNTAYADALKQAIDTLEALASRRGEEHEAFLRIAEHDGHIYIDLGTPTWEAVKISSDGWEVVTDYPVKFRRVSSQLPLPTPEKGGKLDTLRQFFQFENQGWVMLSTWIVYTFKPGAPYPIAILHGSQGSGKSTLTKAIKKLTDPGKAPLIRALGDERNFAIMANNSHVMAIDNLSCLSNEQSDLLCTASTGGGFRTRALHTNSDEAVFEYRRPIIMNGIDSVATRGDLLDRAMLIPVGKPDKRRSERELWGEFEKVYPQIFGAICDALSIALRNLPTVKLPDDTRMVDFAEFGTALEPAMGLKDGDFMRLYLSNKQEAHETALENSPLAQAILELVEGSYGFGGTASELLSRLEETLGEDKVRDLKKQKQWPSNATYLSKALGRLEPDLRACGIKWTMTKDTGRKRTRFHFLQKGDDIASVASDNSQNPHSVSILPSDASENHSVRIASEPPSSVRQISIPTSDASEKDADASENLASALEPAHSKDADATDATDAKKPLFTERTPDEWKVGDRVRVKADGCEGKITDIHPSRDEVKVIFPNETPKFLDPSKLDVIPREGV
jgi:hypothetical protein